MVKIFAFLTKREDMETQAFIDYYEKNHVPLVLSHILPSSTPSTPSTPSPSSVSPIPISYKRNYLMRGDPLSVGGDDAAIDFDVVTELVFPTREAFQVSIHLINKKI